MEVSRRAFRSERVRCSGALSGVSGSLSWALRHYWSLVSVFSSLSSVTVLLLLNTPFSMATAPLATSTPLTESAVLTVTPLELPRSSEVFPSHPRYSPPPHGLSKPLFRQSIRVFLWPCLPSKPLSERHLKTRFRVRSEH
jgi:hypothetical protein